MLAEGRNLVGSPTVLLGTVATQSLFAEWMNDLYKSHKTCWGGKYNVFRDETSRFGAQASLGKLSFKVCFPIYKMEFMPPSSSKDSWSSCCLFGIINDQNFTTCNLPGTFALAFLLISLVQTHYVRVYVQRSLYYLLHVIKFTSNVSLTQTFKNNKVKSILKNSPQIF